MQYFKCNSNKTTKEFTINKNGSNITLSPEEISYVQKEMRLMDYTKDVERFVDEGFISEDLSKDPDFMDKFFNKYVNLCEEIRAKQGWGDYYYAILEEAYEDTIERYNNRTVIYADEIAKQILDSWKEELLLEDNKGEKEIVKYNDYHDDFLENSHSQISEYIEEQINLYKDIDKKDKCSEVKFKKTMVCEIENIVIKKIEDEGFTALTSFNNIVPSKPVIDKLFNDIRDKDFIVERNNDRYKNIQAFIDDIINDSNMMEDLKDRTENEDANTHTVYTLVPKEYLEDFLRLKIGNKLVADEIEGDETLMIYITANDINKTVSIGLDYGKDILPLENRLDCSKINSFLYDGFLKE